MEKGFVWVFVFILLIGVGFADDDEWGEISGGNDSGGGFFIEDEATPDTSSSQDEPDNTSSPQDEPDVPTPAVSSGSQSPSSGQSSKGSMDLTEDFYLALWIALGTLVVLAIVLFFFLRGPKNRWKN